MDDKPKLPKWLRSALVFIALAPLFGLLLVPIIWLVLEINYRSGSHKVLMPGIYKIYLSNDEYRLIVFTRWNSKQINLPDKSPISLEINSDRGELIPVESSKGVFNMKQFDGQNVGGIWGSFTILHPGLYRVSSSNKFVVIITPRSNIEWRFDEWKCPGCDDDFGFVN